MKDLPDMPTRWGPEHGAQPAQGGPTATGFNYPAASTRNAALGYAVALAPSLAGDPARIAAAAGVFERYLRNGPPADPVNPDDLVRPFVDGYEMRDPDYSPSERERVILEDALHGFLAEHWPHQGDAVKPYRPAFACTVEGMFSRLPLARALILNQVALERSRQEGKGYDAAHDDAHSDGRIAVEAAAALLPTGAYLTAPLEMEAGDRSDWINRDQPERERLIQGIALAVAEVERIDRARAAELAEAERAAIEAEEERTHGADSAVNDPLLSGKRARFVILEGFDNPLAAPAPAVALSPTELAPSDWDDMHHALGRPRDPTKPTHRNYFSTSAASLEAIRFRELIGYWDVREAPASGVGHIVAHVTDTGRAALARCMQQNPELFKDIRIENAGDQPPPAA